MTNPKTPRFKIFCAILALLGLALAATCVCFPQLPRLALFMLIKRAYERDAKANFEIHLDIVDDQERPVSGVPVRTEANHGLAKYQPEIQNQTVNGRLDFKCRDCSSLEISFLHPQYEYAHLKFSKIYPGPNAVIRGRTHVYNEIIVLKKSANPRRPDETPAPAAGPFTFECRLTLDLHYRHYSLLDTDSLPRLRAKPPWPTPNIIRIPDQNEAMHHNRLFLEMDHAELMRLRETPPQATPLPLPATVRLRYDVYPYETRIMGSGLLPLKEENEQLPDWYRKNLPRTPSLNLCNMPVELPGALFESTRAGQPRPAWFYFRINECWGKGCVTSGSLDLAAKEIAVQVKIKLYPDGAFADGTTDHLHIPADLSTLSSDH